MNLWPRAFEISTLHQIGGLAHRTESDGAFQRGALLFPMTKFSPLVTKDPGSGGMIVTVASVTRRRGADGEPAPVWAGVERRGCWRGG